MRLENIDEVFNGKLVGGMQREVERAISRLSTTNRILDLYVRLLKEIHVTNNLLGPRSADLKFPELNFRYRLTPAVGPVLLSTPAVGGSTAESAWLPDDR